MEKKKRSLVKAVIYKTGSILVLAGVSWLVTGDLMEMSAITILYTIIAVTGYYVHERFWARSKWGIK